VIRLAHVKASVPECPHCGDTPEDCYPVQADGEQACPFDKVTFTCQGCGESFDGICPEPPECFA
jgi:hypothetical protein